MVTLIIPTLGKPHLLKCLASLKHIPFPVKPVFVTDDLCSNWAQAINLGLKEAEGDVIIMDDDVTLHPDTFRDFDKYYPHADTFGFKLLFPNGTIQHAGGVYTNKGIGHLHWCEVNRPIPPQYVCHVTTSLIYIKKHVLDELKGMQENQSGGVQFEDLDFSWRCLKAGFRIMCLPGEATHLVSATKGDRDDMNSKMILALEEVLDRHLTVDFMEELEQYPKEVPLV